LEIVLLIGGDSLRDLPTWHLAPQLVSAVHQLGVLRRPGDTFDLSALEKQLPGITNKTSFIDGQVHNISASEIRKRAQTGRPYRYYVLPSVYEYIETHHLYRTA
jgi:nicotinate-nucleotide adenylyltransferase